MVLPPTCITKRILKHIDQYQIKLKLNQIVHQRIRIEFRWQILNTQQLKKVTNLF